MKNLLIKHFWLDELHSNAPKDIIYCILGNKVDLKGDRKIAIMML